jgi:dihydroxy-acid dehydratase
MGVDPARLGGPIIGVASTWTGTMPCNLNQRELADRVSEGVSAAGGLALGFNTIAVSDNQSQGTPGMRASLISREVIADTSSWFTRTTSTGSSVSSAATRRCRRR